MTENTIPNIDTSDYELVRKELLDFSEQPILTFVRNIMHVNRFGLSLFPDSDYVQILIQPREKALILKPSVEKGKDAILWCAMNEKRTPRKMKCKPLYYKIFRMMNWNPSMRYCISGRQMQSNGTGILYFPLTEAISFSQDTEYLPAEWEITFGAPENAESLPPVKRYENAVNFAVEFPQNERNRKKLKMIGDEQQNG